MSSEAAHVDRRTTLGFCLLLAAIALIGVGKAVLSDTLDPDLFWHLRVADQLRADGIGAIVDHLSFSSIKEPWTPYSWLAELAMKKLWDVGGYRATIAVYALCVALLLIFNALSCLALAGPDRNLNAVVGTVLSAYLSFAFLSFRPVTIAIVLLAACAWLILRDRRLGERSRAVWLVVALTMLITNVHLSAVIVSLWVACLLAGSIWERAKGKGDARSVKRYAILLAATSLACLATPMLPGALRAAWHYQSSDVMVASRIIAEMQPIYRGKAGVPTIVILLLVPLVAVRSRQRLRAGEWFLFAASAALLFRWGKFAPISGMMLGPILAATLPTLSDRALRSRLLQVAMSLAIFACVYRIVAGFPSSMTSVEHWINRRGPDLPGYPVAAADFVEKNVAPPPGRPGRIINEFNAGGYLAWRLGNRYRTFLDGRTQLFTSDFWQAVYLGGDEARLDVLRRADADVAILPVRKTLFREPLLKLGWRSVFKDDFAEVLLPP